MENSVNNVEIEDIYARKYKKYETDEERLLARKISMQNYYKKNKEKINEKNRRYKIDKKIKAKLEKEKLEKENN
jgi:hypothetical protein